MASAVPTRGGHGSSRAATQAELGIVAHLLSDLRTHVQPGEYGTVLQAHLASRSSALQLQLELHGSQQASGASGMRKPNTKSAQPQLLQVGLPYYCG